MIGDYRKMKLNLINKKDDYAIEIISESDKDEVFLKELQSQFTEANMHDVADMFKKKGFKTYKVIFSV